MTEKQLQEKKAFEEMVYAIARFNSLNEETRDLTDIDKAFVEEKKNILSLEVRTQIDFEANRSAIVTGVNQLDFARFQIADPDPFLRIPALEDMHEDNLDQMIRNFKPRK